MDADVYVDGAHAATLTRNSDGGVTFAYVDSFLASAKFPIATTLPLTHTPLVTAGGAVPPFFAGLLPEGRPQRMTNSRFCWRWERTPWEM